jgi:hypothetical protein
MAASGRNHRRQAAKSGLRISEIYFRKADIRGLMLYMKIIPVGARPFAALIILGMLLSSKAGAAGCDATGRVGHFVALAPRPAAPYFYYRLGDYVVVASPDVVKDEIQKWPQHVDSSFSKLRDWILSALPLHDEADLYTGVLRDPDVWFSANSLIIDLIESGRVAVIGIGGDPLPRLYVEHEGKRNEYAGTAVRLEKSARAMTLLTRSECIS